jgi:hypothetical protein
LSPVPNSSPFAIIEISVLGLIYGMIMARAADRKQVGFFPALPGLLVLPLLLDSGSFAEANRR